MSYIADVHFSSRKIDREYAKTQRKSRNLQKLLKHNRQTDKPMYIIDGHICHRNIHLKILDVYLQKQQRKLHFPLECYRLNKRLNDGQTDKVNYRVASLLKTD